MIKIASFQFIGTDNNSSNTNAIIRGVEIASAAKRLESPALCKPDNTVITIYFVNNIP